MAIPRIGGSGLGLSVNPGLAPGAPAATPAQKAGLTNIVTLLASQVYVIPAGTYLVTPGPYTFLQYLDPVSQFWKVMPTAPSIPHFIDSDGTNFRLANTTGCPIGAVITAKGTNLTNGIGQTATGLTVAISSNSSKWVPVVGGAVNTTVTMATNAAGTGKGTSYTFPPIVVFSAPPAGGGQATGHSTLSGTTVGSVVVDNQGFGYTTAPDITFINDPRDTTGSGAGATATLTDSGHLTGLYPSDWGVAGTTVPTFTFTPSGATATVIMNFTVTRYALATSGTIASGNGYTAPVTVFSAGHYITTNGVYTNPMFGGKPGTGPTITFPRPARILAGVSGTKLTTNAQVIEDAGLGIQRVPTGAIVATSRAPTSNANPTFTVGGQTDTSYLQPV